MNIFSLELRYKVNKCLDIYYIEQSNRKILEFRNYPNKTID